MCEHAVLLVEDNQDDEALSLRALRKSGVVCNVVVLRTGNAVMNAMTVEEAPTPELIILDFHLPQYNGIEILCALRKQKRFNQVPIVMYSSLQSDLDFATCLMEGANSVVQKPIDPWAYVEKVSMMVKYWLTVHRNLDGQAPSGNSSAV
jgi:DNA-binding response OmpR family regulator